MRKPVQVMPRLLAVIALIAPTFGPLGEKVLAAEQVEATWLAEMPEELRSKIDDQIGSELTAAYTYLDLANYYYQKNFDGFGHWFTAQFYEEVNHARRLMNYMKARNAKIDLQGLSKPSQFAEEKFTATFSKSLAFEEQQTARISALYALANQLGDHQTTSFLKWFLDEQVQEEDMFRNVRDRLASLAEDPTGILALDRELAARAIPAAFVPPAP